MTIDDYKWVTKANYTDLNVIDNYLTSVSQHLQRSKNEIQSEQ